MCEEIINTQSIVPISFDMVFKKMWGDPNNEQRLEVFLSIMLTIPYQTIKGRTQIIDSEKRIENKSLKRQRYDIITKIKLNAFGKVNLEMNLGFDRTDIDRNISFLTHIFNSGIKHGMKYTSIPPVIQINFNDYDVDEDSKEVIDKYYLQNKNEHILTEKLQIWNINIAKCYELWYNKNIENLSEEEQQIVKICALMYIKDKETFERCLEEIKMDEEIKRDIMEAEEDFSSDEEILGWYGTEEEYEALQEAKMYNREQEAIARGIEQGISKRNIEIVTKMLKENIDVNFISRITGLSVEQINNLD